MRKPWKPFLWALFLSFAVLLFCSKSSPLYPINDWSDANIYLTIGKGMTQGQVVYRDLYDHKGPLLYALHALCAFVSFSDFTGVFVMEVLLGAGFLYGAHHLMSRLGHERSAWTLLPLLALLTYTSLSFGQGDSAEEICLPLMMLSMASLCTQDDLSPRQLLLQGFLIGCVFWTKFTLVGVQAGLLLWVLIRSRRRFLRVLLWLMAGFALSTVPWLIYFGANGAIADWLKVYLYDNLFLYSGGDGGSKLKAIVLSGLDWLKDNLRYTVLLSAGLVFVPKRLRLPLWLSAGLGALFVFIGGKSYPYYGFALAGFTVWGLIVLARWVDRAPRWAAVISLALCIACTPLLSCNIRTDEGAPILSAREETMQYQIARHIPSDATLLNYNFMDAGFYTASGLVPQVKYFHRTNVPLDEMLSEQNRYLNEGVCEYVVARAPLDRADYELIAQADSPNFWYESVYLYRRTGD